MTQILTLNTLLFGGIVLRLSCLSSVEKLLRKRRRIRKRRLGGNFSGPDLFLAFPKVRQGNKGNDKCQLKLLLLLDFQNELRREIIEDGLCGR